MIGILTTSIRKEAPEVCGKIQEELAFMSLLSRQVKHTVFIFTPWDIDWQHLSVEGYAAYTHKKVRYWKSKQYPLPNVVYNQIFNREAENRYRRDIDRLKAFTTANLFNSGFFSKFQVYEKLRNTPLADILPETIQLTGSRQLAKMLERFPSVYLKPDAGTRGQGIMKLDLKDGLYYYQSQKTGKTTDRIDDLPVFADSSKFVVPYLAQQSLDLLSCNNNNFDVRVLMQKDGSGKWCMTKKYARISQKGRIVSNLAAGAEARSLRKVLAAVISRDKSLELVKRMDLLAFQICQAMDLRWDGLIGELGIDIGIDRDFKLWLLEINSKPEKATHGKASAEVYKQSFMRPLEYACYLADNSIYRPDTPPE